MKNPRTQTAISFVTGVVVAGILLAIVGTQNRGFVLLTVAAGVLAYIAMMLLLSRTPQQIADDIARAEMTQAYQTAESSLTVIARLARSASWKNTIRTAVMEILKIAQGTLEDLQSDPDAARLQEFVSYIGDFTQALEGYEGIRSGQISMRTAEKAEKLSAFEQDLPTLRSGFETLAVSMDQDKAMLAEAKRLLLKNKMAARGRIEGA